MKKYSVLIIDDDASVRAVLKSRFERRGHDLHIAASGEEALKIASEVPLEVAITDSRMPGLSGFEVLKELKVPTIIITGHGDKESAIKAVEAGAFAFFEKPFDLDSLEVATQRAAERYRLEQEKAELLKKLDKLVKLQGREIEHFHSRETKEFVGDSPKIVEIKETLKRMAQKPFAGLLITGETGTGKEVIARHLHELTHPSGTAPFVALNCSAIPPDLLESELYDHEKGSFSGATSARIGLAKAAREGTLFLDEIGDMDPRHQTKLLRLVQERKFRRVGSNSEINFNGRIVAATHRDLVSLSRENKFREDLYYRLSVVGVHLPPLRDRGSDILTLAQSICQGHGLKGIAPQVLAEIRSHSWPGNIRELGNWIERASILGLHDAQNFLNCAVPTPQGQTHSPVSLDLQGDIKEARQRVIDDLDRRLILDALEKHNDNISAAAKTLGLDRKNLTRRIKELGLSSKPEAA